MDRQAGGGLLEYLWQETGSRYLSDLRMDPRLGRELLWVVARTPAERFSSRQWEDALYYLAKERPAPGEDAADLRKRLLAWLRKRT